MRRVLYWIIAVLLTLFLVGMIIHFVKPGLISSWFDWARTSRVASDNGNNGDNSEAQKQEEQKAQEETQKEYIVDLDDAALSGMYNYSRELLWSSLPDMNGVRTSAAAKAAGMKGKDPKIWDAVTLPFSVTDPAKKTYSEEEVAQMRDELYEEICRNPVFTAMIVKGFKKMNIGDMSIYDLNEAWLKPFADKFNESRTEGFVTYIGPDGQSHEENGEKVVFVKDEFVSVAKRICVLLDRCSCDGVETHATTEYFYLNDAVIARDVYCLFNDTKNTDKLPALMFGIDRKDGTREFRFGFNICDKRLEFFTPEKPKVTPTPGPTAPPTGEPTPTPGPTSTPTSTPKPTKDPSQSSMNQGNAPVGGGTQTGGTPEKPTGDPAGDPSQGHQDPSLVVPTTTPAPTQAPAASSTPAPVTIHENPMDYDPIPTSTPVTVTDPSGQTGNVGNDNPGEEMDEPPV